MEKHFVTFLSPGTFVSESTTKSIESWDVEAARAMAKEIVERHNSRPYGFRFSTRSRGPDDLDSKETATSGIYFLNGRVETMAEIEARNDPKEKILRANMRNNGIGSVVVSDTPWRSCIPLGERDVVLAP